MLRAVASILRHCRSIVGDIGRGSEEGGWGVEGWRGLGGGMETPQTSECKMKLSLVVGTRQSKGNRGIVLPTSG